MRSTLILVISVLALAASAEDLALEVTLRDALRHDQGERARLRPAYILVRQVDDRWQPALVLGDRYNANYGVGFVRSAEITDDRIVLHLAGHIRDDPTMKPVPKGKDHGGLPNHKVLSAKGDGGAFCGLAIEVGEKESHQSFAAFKKAAASAEADASELDKGIARYKAAGGNHLGIHWKDDPLDLGVWRNGKRRDLKADAGSLYRSTVINSVWGSGILEIHAGGASFRCEVDDSGKVNFN